jgi:hypothetical protein
VSQEAEAELAAHAAALADAVDDALPGWVVRSVLAFDPSLRAAAEAAGERARAEVGTAVRELLATDIDQQPTSPLALLRTAVRYPTEVLQAAGVPPVDRDDFAVRAFPDDVYDLSPAAFADIDPALTEPGIAWGAAKAFVHKERRRSRPEPGET